MLEEELNREPVNDLPINEQEQTEVSPHEKPEHTHPDGDAGGNDTESRARQLGWKPKEEFEDNEKWVGAKEFIYRRELMDKIHNQGRTMKRMTQDIETYKKSIENVEKIITQRENLARQQERDAIINQRREAIQNGDVETVERLDERISKIEEPSPSSSKEADLPPETHEWARKNKDWFNGHTDENKEMMQAAAIIEKRYCRENPGASVPEILAEVDRKIRQDYPRRFQNTNTLRKPEVSSSTEGVSFRKNKIDQSKVTPALRDVAKTFVKQGIYKTEDDYYKDFFGRAE